MTNKKEVAQAIWKAFCGELIDNGVKDGEDAREALATALREVVNQLQQSPGVVMCYDILELCDELEAL